MQKELRGKKIQDLYSSFMNWDKEMQTELTQ